MPAGYLSRNPMECDTGDCQICKFLLESDHATIRNISVADVLLGKLSMPFTSIMAWKKTQQPQDGSYDNPSTTGPHLQY